MRTVGATTCRILGHAWTPLEYMHVRLEVSDDGSKFVHCETGPVYIGCARCFLELPPRPQRTPAPVDIVDR